MAAPTEEKLKAQAIECIKKGVHGGPKTSLREYSEVATDLPYRVINLPVDLHGYTFTLEAAVQGAQVFWLLPPQDGLRLTDSQSIALRDFLTKLLKIHYSDFIYYACFDAYTRQLKEESQYIDVAGDDMPF